MRTNSLLFVFGVQRDATGRTFADKKCQNKGVVSHEICLGRLVNMLSDNGTVDFVYKYTNHDGNEKTIEEKIELPFDGDVGELVNKMMNEMEPMMRYLDADVGM